MNPHTRILRHFASLHRAKHRTAYRPTPRDTAAISLFLEFADGDVREVISRIDRVFAEESPRDLMGAFRADYAREVRGVA